MTRYRHPQFKVSYKCRSNISFSVSLRNEETLQGSFDDFDATLIMKEADLSTSQMAMVLYADSVKGQTDEHTCKLVGSSCLNASQHRVIKFQSKDWVRITENEYILYGNLSMCGQSNLIVFEVNDLGTSVDEHAKVGLTRLQFDGVIKRSDFNHATRENFLAPIDEITLKGLIAFKSEIASAFSQNKENRSVL